MVTLVAKGGSAPTDHPPIPTLAVPPQRTLGTCTAKNVSLAVKDLGTRNLMLIRKPKLAKIVSPPYQKEVVSEGFPSVLDPIRPIRAEVATRCRVLMKNRSMRMQLRRMEGGGLDPLSNRLSLRHSQPLRKSAIALN